MKKTNCIAAVAGLGLALTPFAVFAQAPAAQPAPEPAPPAAAPAAIPADQQPTREQLTKLFEIMRLRDQMQNLMKAMPAMVQQQIQAQTKEMASKLPGGNSLTPEQQAAIEKLTNKYMDRAFNIYPVDEMIADMTTIYQRHLSRSDVDAFIVFYQSLAGQHLLDAQPAIMKEYMPMVMDRMRDRTKALTDEMAGDLTKQMEELGKSPAPAAEKSTQK
jgi:hypothetical protein